MSLAHADWSAVEHATRNGVAARAAAPAADRAARPTAAVEIAGVTKRFGGGERGRRSRSTASR